MGLVNGPSAVGLGVTDQEENKSEIANFGKHRQMPSFMYTTAHTKDLQVISKMAAILASSPAGNELSNS